MKRRMLILAAAVAVVAIAGGSVAASERRGAGRTMTVVERALTDIVVDLGATGDSLGDQLPFGNPIYDRQNVHQVGRDEGICFRTNPGLSWECTWTTILDHGSITVQGPFYDDGRDALLAITGGTGIYQNARGQMTLHWRNPAGSEFDFSFRIIG